MIFYKLIKIPIWNMNNCIENYQVSIQQNNLAKYFPFTYFCIKMYKFSEIVIIMMSQSFAMHVVYYHTQIFLQCMIGHHLLQNLSCRFCLHNVWKSTTSCRNMILIWCTMHCEIGGPKQPLKYISAPSAMCLVHWLILVTPSMHLISQCMIHHA